MPRNSYQLQVHLFIRNLWKQPQVHAYANEMLDGVLFKETERV